VLLCTEVMAQARRHPDIAAISQGFDRDVRQWLRTLFEAGQKRGDIPGDVDLDGVIAARGRGALDDAHPERGEPELGIAHELEELGHRGHARRQRGDRRLAPPVGRQRECGTIPEPGLGHRAGL
jgi:hypothetical protein